MYTKKGIILIISIVIVVILLVGGVSAFIILKTDLFKSNQTLFYKYLGQEMQEISALKSEKMIANSNSEKNNSNSKNAKISFTYSDPNSGKLTEVLEKTNIQISGKKNIEQNVSNTQFDVQYDGNSIFTAETRVDNEVYGITSPEILNAFLGVENKDLNKLLSRLNVSNSDSFDSSIQVSNFSELANFTDQEKQAFNNLMTKTINSVIDAGQYTKNKKVTVTTETGEQVATEYSISLSSDELKRLFITFCNNLQTDSIVLNAIATRAKIIGLSTGYTDVNSLSANIGEYVSTITNLATTDKELVKISVYEADGNCIQTQIQTYDEDEFGQYNIKISANSTTANTTMQADISTVDQDLATIKVTKIDNSNNTTYDIAISNSNSLNIELYFENLGSIEENNIQNKLNLAYSMQNTSFGMSYEDTVNFEQVEELEGLDENNCVIINNYDKDSVQSFLISIQEKIYTVYAQKLEQLGLTADYTLESIEQQANEARNELNQQNEAAQQALNEAAQSLQGLNLSETEQQTYNANIETYLGDNRTSAQVKSLIEQVMSLIATYPDRNIVFQLGKDEYTYSSMSTLKGKIRDGSNYQVTGEKNTSTGLYNKIILTEIQN